VAGEPAYLPNYLFNNIFLLFSDFARILLSGRRNLEGHAKDRPLNDTPDPAEVVVSRYACSETLIFFPFNDGK
jgi:hypothetical protein